MSKDLEKLKAKVDNISTNLLEDLRNEIKSLRDDLPAMIANVVRQILSTRNISSGQPSESDPITPFSISSGTDLDWNFPSAFSADFERVNTQLEDHSNQLSKIEDIVLAKVQNYVPFPIPSDINWTVIQSSPEQLHNLSCIVDDHTKQLSDKSQEISDLHGKHQILQQNLNKESADFHKEISSCRLSSTPSIASALIDLTKVVQNFSTVQESVINKPAIFLDPSCATFLYGYVHHVRYRLKNGSLSFLKVLLNSPSVFTIFSDKIHLLEPDFVFPPQSSDSFILKTILEKVFYPEGFTVEGFQLLVSAYPMKTPITIQSAYEYALFIKDVLSALKDILPTAATPISEFWRVVRNGIDRNHSLYYKLQSEHPQQYGFFYKSLERKIIAYFESTSQPRSTTDSNSSSLSTFPYQRNSGGSSTNPSSLPSPLSTPQKNRSVNFLTSTVTSLSCENCALPGHETFNCPQEFCRNCHDQSVTDFFHRPQECCYESFHEES